MKKLTRMNKRLEQVKRAATDYKNLLAQKAYAENNNEWFWGEKAIIEVRSDIHCYGFDYRITKEFIKKYGEN